MQRVAIQLLAGRWHQGLIFAVAALLVSFATLSFIHSDASAAGEITITSVSPSVGEVAGGDSMTITGTGFTPSATVLIAGAAATSVTYISDTTLTAITPAGVAGVRDVSVVDGTMKSTLLRGFTYIDPAPIIADVAPNKGPARGGQEVIITGSNFTDGTKEPMSISNGVNYSCGIYSDSIQNGAAYCWGLNTNGQLGNGTRNSATTPVAVDSTGVLAGKVITSISAGTSHTCVIADGAAYCWGLNTNGQLGNGTSGVAGTSYTPVAVDMTGLLAGKTVTSITAGSQHTCAIADGAAYCWGYGYAGRLGTGSTSSANMTTPVAVTATGVLTGKTVTSITASNAHTCAVADGAAYCWGDGGSGRLGTGSTSISYVPIAVNTSGVLASKIVASISAGSSHTCVVADGAAYCWGSSYLGNGAASSNVPVAVSTSGVLAGKTVVSISAGSLHTCVVADGAAYCWGSGVNGRLGTGNTNIATTPVAVDATGELTGKVITSISAGTAHTCAVASDNRAYCWGTGVNGQLGNDTTTDSLTPLGLMRVSIQAPVVLFGGVPATSVVVESPTRIVAVTPEHPPAVSDITVTLYNDRTTGLVGVYEFLIGPSIASIVPTSGMIYGGDVVTVKGVNFQPGMKIKIGNFYTNTVTYIDEQTVTFETIAKSVASRVDISIEDIYGQQSTLSKSFTYVDPTPVIDAVSPNSGPAQGGQEVVITGSNFTVGTKELSGISSGANHSCGIYSDATLSAAAYCWGLNTDGQLGDGTRNATTTPVAVDATGVLAGKSITAVSASNKHTCVIADGAAYCWGFGASGQLGNGMSGAAGTSYTPVAVNTTGALSGKTVTSISTGDQHTCAVANGAAYCWGYGYGGRLGIGTSSANMTTPTAVTSTGVLSGKSVTSIAAAYAHTCAIADGAAYCWGDGGSGRLGAGNTSDAYTPVAADTAGALAGKTVTAITASNAHTCAIADDAAYCWGGSYLGDGTAGSNYPVAVSTNGVLAGKAVASISSGISHTCVVADGAAYCWGSGVNGRLGTGTTTTATTPVAVNATGAIADKAITSISVGNAHTCVVADDSQAYCWGLNTNSQLGEGTTTDSLVAVGVSRVAIQAPIILFGGVTAANATVETPTKIVAITPAHATGAVDVQIESYDSQTFMLPTSYTYTAPPIISSILPSSGLVAGGDTITVTGFNFDSGVQVKVGAIMATSTTWNNENNVTFTTPVGSYGMRDITVINGDSQMTTTPGAFTYTEPAMVVDTITPTTGPAIGGQTVTITGDNFSQGNRTIRQISASDNHSCGIYDGAAYCWGYGMNGQLGNGMSGTAGISYVPVAVDATGVLAGKTVTAISAGRQHTCAVADGAAYCWGYGYGGRLGIGTGNSDMTTPVAVDATGVLAGKTVTAISAGYAHTCAIADDAAYCWGDGSNGRLGMGNTSDAYTPVAVDIAGALAGKIITAITASNAHTCAIADDAAYCWGGSYLGNGTAGSNFPVAVDTTGALAGKIVTSISAGAAHTCVTASSMGYCWGAGNNGRLGTGNTNVVYTPAAVDTTGALAGKIVTSISAGAAHTCAVASDYQVYCWGLNSNGQLGNGTTTDSLTATTVSQNKSVQMVSAGGNSTCLVAFDGQAYCWGLNSNGQLGNGTTDDSQLPVASQPVVTRNLEVLFDGVVASGITIDSPTQVTAKTPANTAGLATLSVQRYDDDTVTKPDVYTYVAEPAAISVAPSSGILTGGDTITVTGSNFTNGTRVMVGENESTMVTYVDTTTIRFVVPAGSNPVAVDVTLIDSYGQTTTLPAAYTYQLPDPTITSISPTSGPITGGTTVTIRGTGFMNKPSGGSWYSVVFGASITNQVTYINETTLEVKTPVRGSLGLVDVRIQSDYTQPTTLPGAFTYLADHYRFSNQPLNVSANQPGKLTIRAENINNSVVTSPQDTLIQLSTSSASGQFAIDLAESEISRWSHTEVVLPANTTSVDVWYRDASSGTPIVTGAVDMSIFTQQQTIGSKYKLQVTGITSPIKAGDPSSVTVRAVDYTGQPLAGYIGTIRFSSTDAAAHLPDDTVMSVSDGGIKTMTNGVMMSSPGTHCVTVTDTTDSSISGQQCGISVEQAATGTISKLAIISEPQSIPKNGYSAPITIQTQDSAGQAIPVSADTTIYLSTNSSTAEFSHDGKVWSGAPNLEVTIGAGMTAANVYYRDSIARTATMSARDQAGDTTDGGSGDFGLENGTQVIKTGVGAPERMHITGPSNLLVGDKGVVTVELRDAAGNVVTATSDVTIRVGANTDTARFYLAGSPDTAITGPVEFIIPTGSTKGTITVSDSAANTSGNFTVLQFVDGRAETETIRLDDAQWQLQIVSGYPASIKASTEVTQTEAGVSLPVTFELYTDTNEPVTTTTTITAGLSSTLGAQYSLAAEPFTPITQLTFNPGDGRRTVYYRSTTAGSDQLRATAPNLVSTATALEVGASDVARFGLASSSSQVPINTTSAALTVTAYDVFGNVATVGADTNVYMHANQSTMRFSDTTSGPWSVQPPLTILTGQSTAQLYAQDSDFHDDAVTITVSDTTTLDSPDTGTTNGTFTLRVVSQPVASIAFVTSERTVTAGAASDSIQVELRQSDGTPALQDGTTQLRLDSAEGKIVSVRDAAAPGAIFHTIARGESSTTVYYSGEKAGTHTLTAQYTDGITSSQSITVTAAAIASMAFVSQPQTAITGVASAPIRLSFTDTFGNPATSQVDRTLELQSTCDTGSFSESATNWQEITQLQVPAGAVDATVYYKATVVGDCALTVSASGLSDATQTIKIVADAPTRLAIVASTSSPVRGSSTTLTVSLLDQFGNVTVADESLTATLRSSSASGTFSRSAVPFSVGQSTNTASYTDTTSGVVTLDALDVAERIAGATTQLTYRDGDAYGLAVTPSYATTRAGNSQQVAVGVVNSYGVVIAAPQAETVTLGTSQPGGLFTNTSGETITELQLAQGQLSADVFYGQQQSGNARITASSTSLEPGDGIITFLSSDVASMQFSNVAYTGSRSLQVGQSGSIQVTLYDAYGNITTASEDVTLYARSSHEGGSFSQAGKLTVAAGSSTSTITYTQSAIGDFSITMSDTPNPQSTSGGLSSIVQQGTVVYGDPYSLKFVDNELPLERGAVSDAVTVQLLNQYDQVVPAGSGGQTIELQNLSSTTGRYATSKNGTFTSTLFLYVAPGASAAQFYYRNDTAQIEDRTCTIEGGERVCRTTRTYQHTIYGRSQFESGLRGTTLPVRMTYGAPTQLGFVTPPRTTGAHSSSPAMTVERQNQYGKAVPVYEDQVIYLRSTSASGVFSSDKIDWQSNGAITLRDSDSQISFYYKDSSVGTPTITAADTLPIGFDTNLTNATQLMTIQPSSGPQEVVNFLVTNITDPLSQGTVSSVVVVARDKNGDSVADYSGTISFSSNDPAAILPDSYTFNPLVDKGLKTFISQVAFTTAGEKTVTVTDSAGITGAQLAITVTDGSSEPVSRIVFAQPESPMVVAKDQPSRNITLELRDSQDRPTNAQAGGYPVDLRSSSPTGEFARSPAGPWSNTLSLSIAQGLSFSTFYYRDSVVGSATIVAENSSGISAEGQLVVVVQTLALTDAQTIRTMNAFGALEESRYLFAHDGSGAISGAVETSFVSRDLSTDELTKSQWRTQWRQGVTLLSSDERSDSNTISLTQNEVATTAGQPDFYAVAEATETSFADFDSVVSRQVTAPVSPWKSAITLEQASPTDISATVTVQRHGMPVSPDTLALQVVTATATSATEALSLWAAASPGSSVTRQVATSGMRQMSTSDMRLGEQYRVLATTYDMLGDITSQVLSDSFTYGTVAVLPPVNPAIPEGELPPSVTPSDPQGVVPSTNTPQVSSDNDGTAVTTPTVKSPTTTQPQPAPTMNGAVSGQDNSGGVIQSAVIAAYATSLLIVVVLLREAYKEVARVYRIRRILRREQQLAVDKNTFLGLSGHYLRTPIAILEAAAHMVPGSVNALQPIVRTLQDKSRMLLDAGVEKEVQAIVSPDIEKATRSALQSWFFWLPVIVSVVLTLLVWGLLSGAERGMFTNQTMVYTAIIAVALGLILFFGARTVMINREQQTMKAALQLHTAQLMNAKTNFIIAVQGELRHEVAALRQILQDSSLSPQMADLLRSSVEKLDSLVTKLQIVTQVNGIVAQPEPFNVTVLVASITKRHQEAIAAKQITIIQDYDDAVTTVTQDVRLLRYVISTVLDNAIKFSQAGGEIAIRTTKQGDAVALSIVNDGGELMTIDMTKQFFEPFSRASNADDLTADGMGLSLYVDKLIMEHLGGSIAAYRAHAGQGVQIAVKFSSV